MLNSKNRRSQAEPNSRIWRIGILHYIQKQCSTKRRRANDKGRNTLLVYFIYGTATFYYKVVLNLFKYSSKEILPILI